MYKIIDLGCVEEHSGDRRVSLIDESYMVKTASNDIQTFWHTFNRGNDKGYLHVIAMTDGNFYGPNNNGDWFDGKDLQKYHPSFVKDGHIFLFHMNKDPKKSIGKPIYSFYNDHMHRVELILEFDKKARGADTLVTKIKNGEDVFVSMGVRVSHDVCSICNHSSKTRAEYCDHLKYNMKKILSDGRQVYAINPGPLRFFDISIVNRPADRTAWALDKMASEERATVGGYDEDQVIPSAELGEAVEFLQEKVAAIKKFSKMVKQVDGDITDIDVGDDLDEAKKIQLLKKQNLHHIDYPVMDFNDMDTVSPSPGGMIRIMVSMGAPPSISEMAYASGKNIMGDRMKEDMIPKILDMIPKALDFLEDRPDVLEDVVRPISDDFDPDEFNNENRYNSITDVFKPVISRRIILIKKLSPSDDVDDNKNGIEKKAIANRDSRHDDDNYHEKHILNVPKFDNADEIVSSLKIKSPTVVKNIKEYLVNQNRSNYGKLDTVTFKDKNGNTIQTNRNNIFLANTAGSPMTAIRQLFGAAIGTAGLAVLFSNKPLLEKVLLAIISGGTAYGLMKEPKSEREYIETEEKTEIPSHTIAFRNSKYAADAGGKWSRWNETLHNISSKVKDTSQFTKSNLPAIAGLAIPSAAALDYLWNKKVRYRNYRNPEDELSFPGKLVYKAGRVVVDNPVSTTVGAALGSVLLNEYLKARKKS